MLENLQWERDSWEIIVEFHSSTILDKKAKGFRLGFYGEKVLD